MSTNTINSDLLDSIRNRDYKKTRSLLEDREINVDIQDSHGWTPLMMAAELNDVETIQILLQKKNKTLFKRWFVYNFATSTRVNTTIKNDLGQTAADVALQFKSRAALNVLKSQKRLTSVKYPTINYFSHVPLNRRADKRKDTVWLENMKTNPRSKFVLFSNLKPLAVKREGEKRYRLSILNYPQIENVLGGKTSQIKNTVFLGIEEDLPENNSEFPQTNSDCEKDYPWFAIDIGHIPSASDKFLDSCPGTEYLSPRPGFLQVHIEDATILAQARPILEWHLFNRFCPRCGSAVAIDDGGYKQRCTNSECSSNKGVLNVSYPRMDPVSIMLVISQDGTKCLLGRKPTFPKGMYSCLAGYMEPGETIEDAVRREVLEESGVKVGLVEYHSSQFWPYPTQLMIGCLAHAMSDEITVDNEELEDAKWFTLDRVKEANSADGSNPLWFPPRQAIARQLIERWLDLGLSHL